MRIGIMGAGIVGQTLGARLVQLGHDVVVGTRRPTELEDVRRGGGSLRGWLEKVGDGGRVAGFPETASHGEVVVNATAGVGSLEALEAAGPDNLAGKILIDIANPLDFSEGFPPSLTVCNTDSLAEQIQRAHPEARVVKTLNTMTAALMVNPGAVGDGDHTVFISGDDPGARARVGEWLEEWFGWRDVIDLGGLSSSRGTEMWLALWVRVMSALDTPMFNLKIVR
jgi:predicted dinucleotide-binding enzyme